MKRIIYTCPYVPAEWIAAHGLQPSRIIPSRADTAAVMGPREGVCPYARAFISEVVTHKQVGGVIVTTVCDQMRRAFDVLVRRCDVPAFLMNVPNTWQSIAAQRLYLDELRRLGRFLERLGGRPPSSEELIKVMLAYDAARLSIRSLRGLVSARRHAEMLAALGRQGPLSQHTGPVDSKRPTDGVPLAIVGGPLMREDFYIFDMVEDSGGQIVFDATETGERGMCPPFDRRRLRDDPLMELATAYFAGIHDASRRPNSELYKWLQGEFAARGVRGILFQHYLWCDIWHAELQRLKDWAGLAVLALDPGDQQKPTRHRTSNRIRAFMEMLQ